MDLTDGGPIVGYGRYRLERQLGEGGMAVVHEAVELASGRRVALKRLHAHSAKREAVVELFKREFLTLAQLAHPRIVTAYDFGVDDAGPYYTMELLDGGDLARSASAPYQVACAHARDVCSALSLVHARRMVFRDLSPHNVRCTSDGLAKLIDFGALSPFGPSLDLVGTLPCVAPEVLRRHPLDARTDLYAVGATLYFTLTHRHAFPARAIDELEQMWARGYVPPSKLIAGIPRALDELVGDLLQRDPASRPASAGEVMERLTAIGGLAPQEHLLVAQAYLAQPTLVGREPELASVRGLLEAAKQRRGGAVSLVGVSGTGRSRLLETSALEGKLTGMLVLRIGEQDSNDEYAAVRALVRELVLQLPQLARERAGEHLPLLAGIAPELLQGQSQLVAERFDGSQQAHRRVQNALRSWLCSLSQVQPLLVAIDDVDRLDTPSAAFAALLAREAPQHALAIVTTRAPELSQGQTQGALELLTRASVTITLSPLELALTEQLLRSVFGDVPNVTLAARHVQRITSGNPRDVMLLARHLVSAGIVLYQSGGWSLPHQLSPDELPLSMADALGQRLQQLSESARLLCYGLSCEPAFGFTLEECARMLDHPPLTLVQSALQELCANELARDAAGQYRARESATSAPLTKLLSAPQQAAVDLALAELSVRHGDDFRAARHLFRAGQDERAVALLAEHAVTTNQRTDATPAALHELLQSLPLGWLHTYEEALRSCQRLGRPTREVYALLRRVITLLPLAGTQVNGFALVGPLLELLRRDAGLDLYEALPATLEPGPRIQRALAEAGARYAALDPRERVLNPSAAIPELTNLTVAALGNITATGNYEAWRELPSLAPFAPLAPTFMVIDRLVEAVGRRLGGYIDEALASYGALLERLAQPDRAGIDPTRHMHARVRVMGGHATVEATMGRAACLLTANEIEREPLYESMAWLVRQLHHLYQGDLREAKRTKQQIELLLLESNVRFGYEAHHMYAELAAYALARDLTGVRRAVDAIAQHEVQHPVFRAALHYGRGEQHHIRGDQAQALRELSSALALMKPGEHILWPQAARAHLATLVALDRLDEACALGAVYLEQGKGLGFPECYPRIALSIALDRAGRAEQARELADEVIERLQAYGCR